MTATPARTYTLLGLDGVPYRSPVPGMLGGHRRGRLYGRLDCPSAVRALSRGGYAGDRVFFADEATAVAAGYRPCAVCLPMAYAHWKADRHEGRRTGRMPAPSPLVDPAEAQAYGELPPPVAHTTAGLLSLIGLLTAARPSIGTVVVGHSRDTESTASAAAFTEAWEARGGTVLATVDWPETAASWLRAGRRLTSQGPDAWVIAAAAPGFVQLARRLRHSTDWEPSRTYAFGSLCDPRVPALAGPGVLHGLRGASDDGDTWEVRDDWITMSEARTSG